MGAKQTGGSLVAETPEASEDESATTMTSVGGDVGRVGITVAAAAVAAVKKAYAVEENSQLSDHTDDEEDKGSRGEALFGWKLSDFDAGNPGSICTLFTPISTSLFFIFIHHRIICFL